MTYCVGILVEDGLVMIGDTRTYAGIDNIATFRKLHKFEVPGERVIGLATSGNLSVSQSVLSLLREGLLNPETGQVETLLNVHSMTAAAHLIGRAMRKIVTRIAQGETEKVIIDGETLRDLLGKPRYGYRTEAEERTDRPGVATGLAWTPFGGDVLYVEAAFMRGSKGFQYTGQLGEVMQESARIALSYIRSKADTFDLPQEFFEKNDIHLHVPEGATPKDGPSAGVTMTVALASLLTGRLVRGNVAMTGEITLRGKVLPVGGIKDKVLAADRNGLDTIILPKKNEKDLDDLPQEVRDKLRFVPVESIDEAFEAALVGDGFAHRQSEENRVHSEV